MIDFKSKLAAPAADPGGLPAVGKLVPASERPARPADRDLWVPLHQRWAFDHPPRAEQLDLMDYLDQMVHTGSRFLNLEAPVGTGKSPVAVTFAHAVGAHVLVPQNSLQAQYLRDWPDMANVRGATNYACINGKPDHPSCRRGRCSYKKDPCRCPYVLDKARFYNSSASLTSYAMFLALLVHAECPPPRRWIVMDESHNADEAMVGASEVSFTELDYLKHVHRQFPRHYGDEAWTPDEVKPILQAMADGLGHSLEVMGDRETDESVGWEFLRDQIGLTLESIDSDDIWISNIDLPAHGSQRPSRFWTKPLLPKAMFRRITESYRVMALSATPISSPVASKLYGVHVEGASVGSPFPVENRVIHYNPVARMSYKNYDASVPVMARAVARIIHQFKGDKGIVHTNSFKLTADLHRLMDADARKRVILHTQGMRREELINRFLEAEPGAVLMSPSMTEGLDLKDDQGRFNVIAKVPYPALGDPWVKKRKDEVEGWYDWRTALSIAQATGRTTRSMDDWSTTIILDQSFGGLYDHQRHLFPTWFTEAVR